MTSSKPGMVFLDDIRVAARSLVKSPWFTAAAIASLAAGVAASSAIYTVTSALTAPSPGVRDHTRVLDIGRGDDGSGFDNMSHPAFEYLRAHGTTFDAMAAVEFGGRPMSLTRGGTSERVFGTLVSANLFEVLGTRAALGRFFRPDEDIVPGARPVAVLTHRFWTERLGADPAVLERPLRLNNHEFTVVGVAEPGFEGVALAGTDLWVPMAMVAEARGLPSARMLREVGGAMHMGVGRLKAGVSEREAHAELNTLMRQFKAANPDANQRHTVSLLPTSRIPGPLRTPFLAFLGVLFVLTGALLAVASSNVASLLLARASARHREIATRLALGAGRGRLLRQLLTETSVLFVLAGLAGIPLTMALVRLMEASLPSLPILVNLDLAVSPDVAIFALGLSLVAAGLSGLAPARHALSTDLAPLLHGAVSTPRRHRMGLRQALVVTQVALATMLVVTAGLFARTLRAAATVDPGFDTADIVLANVDVSLAGFRDATAVDLVDRYLRRLASLPGVDSVAASRMIPLQGSGLGLGEIHIANYASPRGDDVLDADWNVVSPEYFDVLGMRLVDGRPFSALDRATTSRVAIVNETFAQLAWPGRSAVGQRFVHADDDGERQVEVVGVAVDARYRYINDAPEPFVFVPMAQIPMGDVTFLVKHRPGVSPAAQLRSVMAQVEPSVAVMFVQAFDDAVAIGLTPQRFTAWIAGLVGAASMALASLGLYGLMTYSVVLRRREIAIRVALGAGLAHVRRLVLGQAAWLAGLGSVVGIVLAAGLATLLRALLVGVTATDATTYLATTASFGVVLGLAAWIPARRTAGADPVAALRAE